ncbi:mycothiol synthase [Sphaerisporangium corydalis]|uniref:Mycothiol acetyltransferase n=1 Tax=Sphaerisporangium corydalis TaxID=1441875 RepID=A0ABV9ERG9_9ACTN|nr:mycothiol synthase [Sphaerisporangium corydalis]
MNARVDIRERLGDQEVADVAALTAAAAEADSISPLNEQVMLHLRHGGGDGTKALLLYQDDTLAGFAHVGADGEEGPSGELVVHPGHRGQGLGRLLAEAALAESGGRLRLWAHGDRPEAARLGAALGFTRARSLWQMRRPTADPLPPAKLPDGVRLRAFEPGADEEAWLAVNARAFAHHPEQGSWTMDDLTLREREPWFDPSGFFLAVRETAGEGARLAGFHWTKVHADGGPELSHAPIGEVYVVGVDPSEQGTGLGRALTLAGLDHLRSAGLDQVMLYVDEDNPSAIHLYQSFGFTRWKVDVMYRHG